MVSKTSRPAAESSSSCADQGPRPSARPVSQDPLAGLVGLEVVFEVAVEPFVELGIDGCPAREEARTSRIAFGDHFVDLSTCIMHHLFSLSLRLGQQPSSRVPGLPHIRFGSRNRRMDALELLLGDTRAFERCTELPFEKGDLRIAVGDDRRSIQMERFHGRPSAMSTPCSMGQRNQWHPFARRAERTPQFVLWSGR